MRSAMKVLLVGAYPPPSGGNSVHIKRLHSAIQAQGMSCNVVDLYGRPDEVAVSGVFRIGGFAPITLLRAIALIRKERYDIVHFHVSALDKFVVAGPILLASLHRISRSVLSIHSGQFNTSYESAGIFKRWLFKHVLRKFNSLITVNAKQKDLLTSIEINPLKVAVVPAYIPPISEASNQVDACIKKLRSDGRSVLISSGYGEALYGYHHIVNAIRISDALKARTSLLLCLYNRYDRNYMSALKDSLAELESVEIVQDLSAEQFAYALTKADLYVRATSSDGDAVAIREAHHFGIPVLASDVIDRPPYCRLFKYENLESLKHGLLESITLRPGAQQPHDMSSSSAEDIARIYSSLLDPLTNKDRKKESRTRL